MTMHGTITKSEPVERILLDRQAIRLGRAWNAFVRTTRDPDTLQQLRPLLERKDINAILRIVEHSIGTLAGTWIECANEVLQITAVRVSRQLSKATVSASFEPGDRRAAALMRRSQLEFVQGLTLPQRNATRAALADGIKRGLGTEALARSIANSIGLDANQQRLLQHATDTWRRNQANVLDREAGFTDADFLTPEQIEFRVNARAKQYRDARAETVARTEALRVTSEAQDIALRESLRSTGIDEQTVYKTWNTTRDGRERPEHAARDGVTIPINESFAPGIMKPGDGGAREAANCRCVLTFSFKE